MAAGHESRRPLSAPSASSRLLEAWLAGAAIVLLVLAVFSPAVGGGFVFDDDAHLTDNVVLEEDGLYRVWFDPPPFDYYPVTWTAYWLQYQLFGLNLAGFHIVNLLAHAGCALLIWRVLLRLFVPGAWLAAAVFAVHPVNVETAAWIAQLKTILSMLFLVAALLLFLRFTDRGRRRELAASLFLFLLAMLSKGAAVTLPLVILLCLVWRRGALARRDVRLSLPYFAVAAMMSIVVLVFMQQVLHGEVVRDAGFFERLAGAGWAVWFYLYKAVLPFGLTVIYPRWEIDPALWLSYVPGLLLAGLLVLFWRFRRSWGRHALFALLYYIVALLPALGFFDVYFWRYSLVGDHYQYVAIIGVIAPAAAAGVWAARRLGCARAPAALAAAGLVIAGLGVLSWHQSHIYKSMEALWQDTAAKNPSAWLAHHHLAGLRRQEDDLDAAVRYYREALRLNPDFERAHQELGDTLCMLGDFDGAVEHFREAVRLKPGFAPFHNSLGAALHQRGDVEAAIEAYRRALELDPKYANAHFNLGTAFCDQGRLDEAVEHMRRALEGDPNSSVMHNSLGGVLLIRGDVEEAVRHFERALEIDPSNQHARANLHRSKK